MDRPTPILPPAAIGILGGGQLGQMLALAARAMGYRIQVLDPDPECPAAAVVDRVVVGGYDDVDAALRLAGDVDVVTYELEHVAAEVVAAIEAIRPVRPGHRPLTVTQDRLAERRFVEAAGIRVAPWREVRSPADLAASTGVLGHPLRLKAPIGGYDGRSQVRVTDASEAAGAWAALGLAAGAPALAELELAFEAELSIVVSRGIDGRVATYPIARNLHERGVLVETVAPAPIEPELAVRATAIGAGLAEAMDLVGTLTAELFHLPDGSLVVNELAPRVHNSGHWTIEGARTSQFEQHIRAICGLGLGSADALAPAAMVNLLGHGPRREAHLAGVDRALSDPAVHLHVYGKRQVFQGRKMGHVTALGDGIDDALAHARAAAAHLDWALDVGDDGVQAGITEHEAT